MQRHSLNERQEKHVRATKGKQIPEIPLPFQALSRQ
jgi:hypothetical protein